MRGMRNARGILLIGFGVGIVCGVILVALTLIGGLVAIEGIVVTGIVAGLATAKWLPWSWYGHQARAGVRAGGLACALAAAALLAAFWTFGPRSTTTLAARSHLLGQNWMGWLHALAFVGWAGAELVACLLAALVGTALATGICLLFALGKNARVVATIAEARDAAEALQRGQNLSRPLPGFALPSAPPASGLWHATPLPAGETPMAGTLLPRPPSTPLGQRMTSTARPLGSEMTSEQEAALRAWGGTLREQEPWSESEADGEPLEDAELIEESPDSSYLNSPKPKRRKRKPVQTRDWLC